MTGPDWARTTPDDEVVTGRRTTGRRVLPTALLVVLAAALPGCRDRVVPGLDDAPATSPASTGPAPTALYGRWSRTTKADDTTGLQVLTVLQNGTYEYTELMSADAYGNGTRCQGDYHATGTDRIVLTGTRCTVLAWSGKVEARQAYAQLQSGLRTSVYTMATVEYVYSVTTDRVLTLRTAADLQAPEKEQALVDVSPDTTFTPSNGAM